MVEQDIIQNLIFQLGQSQNDRLPPELREHSVDVDEQTTADLLAKTKELAKLVNFYQVNGTQVTGNWTKFWPEVADLAQLLAAENQDVPPHLALFLAFLELYKQPQGQINNITARHLEFYYRDVLGLKPRDAIADRVHLLLELKKNAAPLLILPEQLFSAGQDATKVELLYAPTRPTVINGAKVESLRSIFFDPANHGAIRWAFQANSADGFTEKLPEKDPTWSGFGHPQLPLAEVGFGIAAAVLRMQAGRRTIHLSLRVVGIDLTQILMNSDIFDFWITGAKGWLPCELRTINLDHPRQVLLFDLMVPASAPAIVDYAAALHGGSYDTTFPILRCLLKQTPHATIGYNELQAVKLGEVVLTVRVSGITALQLESENGLIDSQKAFLPFGPQPTVGSRFFVDYPEATAKPLSNLRIRWQWKAPPSNFSTYYAGYGYQVTNNSFMARVTIGGTERSVQLFNASDARIPHDIDLDIAVYDRTSSHLMLFSLQQDFLQDKYRRKYVESIIQQSKSTATPPAPALPNEPYVPTIQSISLDYTASTGAIDLTTTDATNFENSELQFFHITYFGQRREHGYLRQQIQRRLPASINPALLSVFPQYDRAGELLIGLSHLQSNDSVSILFQVAEGSAEPDLPATDIRWSVLCSDHWQPLSTQEVVLDSTNQLLASGIIQFMIPATATTEHHILPRGLIWLKAAIQDPVNVRAVCQLIEVAANAIEVKFVDQGNDPHHLQTALAPHRITKLQTGIAVLKTVKQPYASFGGQAVETNDQFHTRVSERLHHKHRAIASWDYERLVLGTFPRIHQVKCIPHAKEGVWLAPGHVLIVLVPELKYKNAMNLLAPRVDKDTIQRITKYLQERAGMGVEIAVKNPNYQQVQLDFQVKFHPGYEVNYHRTLLEQEIIRFLSPWAYDAQRELSFGGKIYRSVLLNFVEDLVYVDYVTDFKMYSPVDNIDRNVVQSDRPDTILVSSAAHRISLLPI